ncbi:MAG TPA: WecB/TagA/CpsF family glycosyltransferase [Burkholderiaceae bacterium]|jgi:N-acetylglucosaminyldiphosphoundecaprenol N-acetyl-beta-D-mannosaminyltransferase|nr:WecB/TagA/CpsF family glycosyltransferase [Burkholderiaceae bacterium]
MNRAEPYETLRPEGAREAMDMAPGARIKGLPISTLSHEQVLQRIARGIEAGQPGRYISITNTESMYHGLRDELHGRHIREADMSLCDGVGVIVAGWTWGHRITRYNGPVLQLQACEYGQPRGWRHFFYGGKPGVADEMARRLKERFPDLQICGTYCPPFQPLGAAEDAEVVERINASRPDIVWVGLGLVKQERWIQQHLGRVRAPWMVGVGAAFDYHAGTVPWAPPVLRKLGLEWLFRLVLQPRLRARRYWWSFVYVVQASTQGLLTLRFMRRGDGRDEPASHELKEPLP